MPPTSHSKEWGWWRSGFPYRTSAALRSWFKVAWDWGMVSKCRSLSLPWRRTTRREFLPLWSPSQRPPFWGHCAPSQEFLGGADFLGWVLTAPEEGQHNHDLNVVSFGNYFNHPPIFTELIPKTGKFPQSLPLMPGAQVTPCRLSCSAGKIYGISRPIESVNRLLYFF